MPRAKALTRSTRPVKQTTTRRKMSASSRTPQCVVVTMTLARNPAEAATLTRALGTLSELGLPIYVGEGGSDPGFIRTIKRLPHVQIWPRDPNAAPGLVSQLQTAFAAARQASPEHVIYTEPDKRTFFQHGLHTLIEASRAPQGSGRGLLIAARDTMAFGTFPEGQRTAEGLMNQICGEALGQVGDYTYGPMLIHRDLLPYIDLAPTHLSWGWRFFLMAVARQLQLRTELALVGSPCPPAQRGEDDAAARAYRLRQLEQNVTGLANGWTCLLDAAPNTATRPAKQPRPQPFCFTSS